MLDNFSWHGPIVPLTPHPPWLCNCELRVMEQARGFGTVEYKHQHDNFCQEYAAAAEKMMSWSLCFIWHQRQTDGCGWELDLTEQNQREIDWFWQSGIEFRIQLKLAGAAWWYQLTLNCYILALFKSHFSTKIEMEAKPTPLPATSHPVSPLLSAPWRLRPK